jgi:pantoate--beta-alanine ligase
MPEAAYITIREVERMQIVRSVEEMRRVCREVANSGCTIGFVPTMGALHAGHLSLVRRSRAECDVTVASIFVNPKQFAANEDFSRYPRSFDEDCRMLEREGVAAVFAPTAEEMYSGNAMTLINPGEIGERLDGVSRPGHFTGVTTVVAKLFNIVAPTRAYFGQKDAAQLAVLRRVVGDLNFNVELVACPTVREADGLAMSSRNRYLTQTKRKQARSLYLALRRVAAMVAIGELNAAQLMDAAHSTLAAEPDVRIDYIALVSPETLLPVERAMPDTLFAIAAWVGETRLIDNWIVGEAL